MSYTFEPNYVMPTKACGHSIWTYCYCPGGPRPAQTTPGVITWPALWSSEPASDYEGRHRPEYTGPRE